MKILIGNCTDESVVADLFGSVTDFAKMVEDKGDSFILPHDKIAVEYDEETDIHYFYSID